MRRRFSFTPSHTCWLSTNHRPKVGDDGDAIWRRLLLIPFAVTIPKDEWDLELDERLKLEVDGIIAWIVRGALEYAESGIDPPARVLAATNEYRSAESTFSAWIEEALQFDRNAWTSSKDLHESYADWARYNDAEELSNRERSQLGSDSGQISALRRDRGRARLEGHPGSSERSPDDARRPRRPDGRPRG